MKPDPRLPAGRPGAGYEFTICDPACGTGGFLVCAYEWLVAEAKGVFDRADARRIKSKTYFGQVVDDLREIVALVEKEERVDE